MRKTYKWISLVLVISVFCVPLVDFRVVATADNMTTVSKANVIDKELANVLLKADEDDLIPVDIWFYESQTLEEREAEIKSSVGINKDMLYAMDDKDVTTEMVDAYIVNERQTYANAQADMYAKLQEDYSDIKNLQKSKSNQRQFFSSYAPLIRVTLTPEEIAILAKDSRVDTIYYSPDVKMADNTNVSIPLIRANYTRDTVGCTGSGIKIGMIECTLPDKNETFLAGSDIYHDPNVPGTTGLHATFVASIMVGQTSTWNGVTYRGIVPNAKLYSTRYPSSNTGEWRERVE